MRLIIESSNLNWILKILTIYKTSMKKFYLLMLALLSVSVFAKAETTLPKELQQYKLDNGLTVILWEDHDQPDVEGYVVTRAGAIDEPREYTGLAHYLQGHPEDWCYRLGKRETTL